FIPLAADPPSYVVSAYELMTRMAVKYPAQVRCEKLPYLQGALLNGIHRKVREKARSADFVFLGVGPWDRPFTALAFVRRLGEDPEQLGRKYSEVACMCGYCALDRAGGHIPLREVEAKMPRALTFRQLRRLAGGDRCQVVLLAATLEKLDAVLTALRAGVCN